jgi:hypothetical protein
MNTDATRGKKSSHDGECVAQILGPSRRGGLPVRDVVARPPQPLQQLALFDRQATSVYLGNVTDLDHQWRTPSIARLRRSGGRSTVATASTSA